VTSSTQAPPPWKYNTTFEASPARVWKACSEPSAHRQSSPDGCRTHSAVAPVVVAPIVVAPIVVDGVAVVIPGPVEESRLPVAVVVAALVMARSDLVEPGVAGGDAAVSAVALAALGVSAPPALHDTPTTASAASATIVAARRVAVRSVRDI
jgi:hypothetical protein